MEVFHVLVHLVVAQSVDLHHRSVEWYAAETLEVHHLYSLYLQLLEIREEGTIR